MGYLDFPNTCPRIDEAISDMESIVDQNLEELILEICPFISPSTICDILAINGKVIKDEIKKLFEVTRTLNSDMRDQAEAQIGILREEISDLEYEVDALSNE
jgi:hypothetical protein